MENNQQQILSEIKSLMASVRGQLEELDAKIAQWQQIVEPDEVIDMTTVMDDFGFFDKVYEYAGEILVEQPVLDIEEPVAEPVEEHVAGVVEETVIEEVQEPVELSADDEEEVVDPPAAEDPQEVLLPEPEEVMPVVEAVELPTEDADDDLPFFDVPEDVPETPSQQVNTAPAQKIEDDPVDKLPVIDVMTQKHRWRTAIPGAPVKDVRGAIALMDRVLFINTLFGTDPMAFQETLTQINQMQTLIALKVMSSRLPTGVGTI